MLSRVIRSAALFCHSGNSCGSAYDAVGACEREMDADAAAARCYRKRAKELRATAESLADWRPRKILLGFAEDYERLARVRVTVGKVNRAMASTTIERRQAE